MANTTIKNVINNIKDIYMSDSMLSTLMDFERVLSELDLYAFANWKQGELVSGPIIEKYFITATFMWPYTAMPDPRGGERLLGYDCEISYELSHLEYPVKVKTRADFKAGTNMPRMQRTKIWLVTIVMPRVLINEIHQGVIELENSKLDIEEIEYAYQSGTDEDDMTTASEDQSNEHQF